VRYQGCKADNDNHNRLLSHSSLNAKICVQIIDRR